MPTTHGTAMMNQAAFRAIVRQWIELTDNPGAFMILMEQGPDGLPDPATEVHVPLHRGARCGDSAPAPAGSPACRLISCPDPAIHG